jgi:hypothetical protein
VLAVSIIRAMSKDLRAFENKELTNKFRRGKQEEAKGWRKLKELHN